MERAGLLSVEQLSLPLDGSEGLAPLGPSNRAQVGTELLGLPLIEAVLTPCWHCGSLTEQWTMDVETESCWPPAHLQTVASMCAIKRKRLVMLGTEPQVVLPCLE